MHSTYKRRWDNERQCRGYYGIDSNNDVVKKIETFKNCVSSIENIGIAYKDDEYDMLLYLWYGCQKSFFVKTASQIWLRYVIQMSRFCSKRAFDTRTIYETFDSLEVLINNAALTVEDNEDIERQILLESNQPREIAGVSIDYSMPVSTIPLNVTNIRLNDESQNAWMKTSGEISIRELLETQIINVTAPYLLSTAFRQLMERLR